MLDDREKSREEQIAMWLQEGEALRRLARELVGSGPEADDLVQEAWLTLLRKEGPRESGAFRAWMRSVLRRRAVDLHRERVRRRAREERVGLRSVEDEPPDAVVERLEMHRLLIAEVQALEPVSRRAIVDRYFDGLTSGEIARREGIAEATVRSRVARALSRLRERLDRRFGRGRDRLGAVVALCTVGGWDRVTATTGGSASWGAPASASVGSAVVGGTVMKSLLGIAATVLLLGGGAVWWFRDLPPSRGPEESTPLSGAPLASEEPAGRGEGVVGARVAGVVRDVRDGAPISGVDVVWTPGPVAREVGNGSARSDSAARSQTDIEGAFSVVAPGGTGSVRFRRPGYEELSWHISDRRRREGPLEVWMVPGVEIAGRVYLPDGSEASTGRVHLEGHESLVGGPSGSTRIEVPVDADGSFRTWLRADAVTAIARVPGHVPARRQLHAHLDDFTEIVLRVTEGITFEGRIEDPGGRPVRGATVRIEWPDGWFPGAGDLGARSDAGGRFVVAGAPSYTPDLIIEHPDHVPLRVRDVSLLQPRLWTLEPARVLEFTLRSPDLDVIPAEDVHLVAGPPPGRHESCTREEGRFRSPPLDPSVAEVTLFVRDHRPVTISWERGTGTLDLGTIDLETGTELRLRLVDTEGEPAGVLPIDFERLGYRPHSPYRTDEEGRVRIAGLDPGPFRLRRPVDELLELVPGRNEHTLVVEPRPGRARLSGRLVSAGRPVEGRVVAVVRAGDASGDFLRGEHGRFSGSVIAERELRVSLGVIGRDPVTLEIPPLAVGDEHDLGSIELGEDRSGVVHGRVVDLRGEPVSRAIVRGQYEGGGPVWNGTFFASISAVTGLDGTFSAACAEGSYRLVVHPPEGTMPVDGRDSASVVVVPGGRSEVEFAVRRTVGYTARVVHDDGRTPAEPGLWFVQLRAPDGEWTRGASVRPDGVVRVDGVPDTGEPLELVVFGRWRGLEVGEPNVLATGPLDRLPDVIRVPRGGDLEVIVEGVTDRVRPSLRIVRGDRDDDVQLDGPRSLLRDLPAGPLLATIHLAGHRSPPARRVMIVPGARERLECTLVPTAIQRTVAVEVVGPGGTPVPLATVRSLGSDDEHGWRWARREERHARGGLVSIALPDSDARAVLAHAEGYAPAVRRLHAGEEPARIRLVLPPESAIVASVVDEGGGVVPSAEVEMGPFDERHESGLTWRALDLDHFDVRNRSRDGEPARVGGLLAGRYVVRARRGNEILAEEVVELRAGEEQSVELRVRPSFTVRGRWTVDGGPVSGGTVWLRDGPDPMPPSWSLDRDGRFEGTLRFPGWYVVDYSAPGSDDTIETLLGPAEVVYVDGTTTLDRDAWSARAVLAFRLPDGTPLAHTAGRHVEEFVTDATGAVTTPRVRAGRLGWRIDAPEGWFGRGEVVLPPGESRVEIDLEPADRVVGRVTCPVPGSIGLAVRRGDRWTTVARASEDGRVEAWLPPDVDRMWLWGPETHGAFVDRQRWAASTEDPIPLVALVRVRVEARENGRPVPGTRSVLFHPVGGGPNEAVDLSQPVVPGRYRIVVTHPDGRIRSVETTLEPPNTKVVVDFDDR